MADREKLSLVIVGHVDHGKSTLIGRLLFDTESLSPEKMEEIRRISKDLGHDVEFAYVMDHLEEERTSMMTIDTAQAFFKSGARDYVIIDAPGHKEFMKNMITGASQAEAALLVVDAGEGMAEQTQRHAYFLSMLGVDQVAVLINKMDKVGFQETRYKQLRSEVEKFLLSVSIKPAHVIPGSAMKGDNIANASAAMPWYKGPTVLGALDTFKPGTPAANKVLRFPLQDVYTVDSRQIMVGRVESGRMEVGQDLVFLPSQQKAKIASIEVFGETRDSAEAEECVGITTHPPVQVDRGEVACPANSAPPPTMQFRANVFWMAMMPCRLGETVLVRSATQEVPGKVERIEKRIDSSALAVLEENAKELKDTEVGQMILRCEKPIVLELFQEVPELGQIVIGRGQDAVGGGLVTHSQDVHLA
jgi:small GTP-binding protein